MGGSKIVVDVNVSYSFLADHMRLYTPLMMWEPGLMTAMLGVFISAAPQSKVP